MEKFMAESQFILPEAYGIFAQLKLIPHNGASAAASEICQVANAAAAEENSDSGEFDAQSEQEDVILQDEEVEVMDLVSCRLKLRPTHNCCVSAGFLNIGSGAIIEARKYGNLEICQSRIEGGGKGVFATENISEGKTLLPYWGDVYVIPAKEVAARVAELDTDRLVKTKKHIKNGAQKQL